MFDLLAQSRPNPNGTGRKELGAVIYQNSDGSYGFAPINDPTATDCGFTVNALFLPTLPPGLPRLLFSIPTPQEVGKGFTVVRTAHQDRLIEQAGIRRPEVEALKTGLLQTRHYSLNTS